MPTCCRRLCRRDVGMSRAAPPAVRIFIVRHLTYARRRGGVERMKYGKLRIAWSVGWGLLCLLLIVLWVRSYWWNDFASHRLAARDFLVQIRRGELGIWCDSTSVAPFASQLK